MIFFVLLIASAAAFNKDVLKSGLQSAEGQVKLFSSWMKTEDQSFALKERAFRFRVFRKHLKEIVEINNAQDDYELDANFMAGLTEQEQQKWYGINITAFPVAPADDAPVVLSNMPTATEKLWRKEGKVTAVKSQGSCGSCWTFAGIGSFEGHYAIKSGGLKRFAEQEFLDCNYEGQKHDGCDGGWYWEAYAMVKRTQHLALSKDYPYKARDGRCLTSSTPNGMKATKMNSVQRPRASSRDSSLVQALNVGPVAMAFEIKGGFSYYKKGVLSVRNCGATPHHAMTVTGYTAAFFEIKNSWGATWGDAGYVRFDRRITNMCGISNWLAYPDLKKTGDDEDDVTPTKDDGDDTDCADKNDSCKQWADSGECKNNYRYMGPNCPKSCGICGCTDGFTKCPTWKDSGYCTDKYITFMKYMCKKTCGHCTDNTDNKCPEGLKFCKGKCQHEHFC